MEYITSLFGYIYEKQESGDKDKLINNDEKKLAVDNEICNIEPTLTPGSMAVLPDNKYVLEKVVLHL